MKKLHYISILVLLLGKLASAQTNLVPNPGFEDTLRCPGQVNHFQGYVSNWYGASDQLFHDSCTGNPDLTIPYNLWGYQFPHSGLGMAGMTTITLDSFASTTNAREYIWVVLSDTLQAGKGYYVSFYVNPSNNAMYACNDMGVYFSKSYVQLNHQVLPVVPQIQNDPINNPLTDTSQWILIRKGFFAQGGEKYMVVGNFQPDSLCHLTYQHEALNNTYDWRFAFYYLDDFSVTLDTLGTLGVPEMNKSVVSARVFPNPNDGHLTLDYTVPAGSQSVLEVMDVCGKTVGAWQLDSYKSTLPLDLSGFAKGLYYYRVLSAGKPACVGKVVLTK